jgi:two-component system, LytTR family, response regulator AlgR
MNILIVDDEELARLRLRSLLTDLGDASYSVVGEAGSVAQAFECLASASCDLVLLDIQMPGSDGLQLAEVLRRDHPATAVIFVTAHAEHALRAFEINAVDYLTKPVRKERLQDALKRASQRIQGAAIAPTPGTAQEPMLVVTDRGRVVRVPVSQVLYLKAELKYVTLRTAQNTYLLNESLAELEPQLGPRFLRVHRNALVARQALRALERRRINSDNEAAVMVGGAGTDEEKDAQDTWAVQIALTGEWLAVSRRQLAVVREAMAM